METLPTMKPIYLLFAALCITVIAVIPAEALSISSLTITIGQNGDAQVNLHYKMTMVEQAAVYFQIADPAAELKNALESNLNRQVMVYDAGTTSADIVIPSFAAVSQGPGKKTITTPGFSFSRVQQVAEGYWFAPRISPDFTPDVTTIVFPDGSNEVLYNQIDIPSFSHQIG